jgi:hypothetical protein
LHPGSSCWNKLKAFSWRLKSDIICHHPILPRIERSHSIQTIRELETNSRME